jgi:sensor histidine kinase YesM
MLNFLLQMNAVATCIRVILVSLYAGSIPFLLAQTLAHDLVDQLPENVSFLIFIYILMFNLNSEGFLWFDHYLNKRLPWFYFPRKRLLIQSAFLVLFSLLTVGGYFTVWYVVNDYSLLYPPLSVFAVIASIILLVLILTISISIRSFEEWRTALMKAEQLKQEKLIADYKVLQNQTNPHFLFNCFNVLISEIKQDPVTAETFTRKLSKVYRYVLQSKNHDLITLRQEVEFIHSFIYLHQIRTGDALKVTFDISEESASRSLPPLTLQILVENAIKHTVMNEENPLYLTIATPSPGALVVKNNLNPQRFIDSTKTGLSNIKARYEILDTAGLNIEKSETEFIVTVPLLDE